MVEDTASRVAGAGADVVFERIRVRRGFEEIYDQIRAEIAAGRLRPGDRLPAERDLATQFGVSRQAVREALRGLQASGLVQSRVGVGGGSFIQQGDPRTISRALEDLAVLGTISNESLLEARILLTSDAVRLVCERAKDEEFDLLDEDIEHLEDLTRRGLLRERASQRFNFYRILSALTHNEVFALVLDSFTGIVQMRVNTAGTEPMPGMLDMRRNVVAALRARDADAAIDLLAENFNKLEAHILAAEARLAAE